MPELNITAIIEAFASQITAAVEALFPNDCKLPSLAPLPLHRGADLVGRQGRLWQACQPWQQVL